MPYSLTATDALGAEAAGSARRGAVLVLFLAGTHATYVTPTH
jgi:hypothetical protein